MTNRTTTCSGNTPANPRSRTSYMTRPGDPPSPDDPLLQFELVIFLMLNGLDRTLACDVVLSGKEIHQFLAL